MKILQTLLLCYFLLTINATAQAQFSGSGAGTLNNPYIITTAAQLNEMRYGLDSHYRLANDIDLTDYLAPGGAGYAQWGSLGWSPIGHHRGLFDRAIFTGSLNGAGFKITGLWMNRPEENRAGFFGWTSDATIDSLGIELAAVGIIGGPRTGGLVGHQGGDNDNISNSYVTGNITGNYTETVWSGTGGLVGTLFGTIHNSYFIGNVTGDGSTGGLVGSSAGSAISNSYSIANVSGIGVSSSVGGLVGLISSGRMSNNYAAGSVSGNNAVGGMIGELRGELRAVFGTTNNSFFDAQTAERINAVGRFSAIEHYIVPDITGLTTKEMHSATTFGAWDLAAVWGIYDGYGYPYLRSFNNDILIVPTGGSKVFDGQPAPAFISYSVVSDNPLVDTVAAKARLTGALAYSVAFPVNAGEYAIRQHTLHSPSHQISFKHDVTYTITPRPITVAAIDETIYYGETPMLAYHITQGSLVSGDALSGTLYVADLSVGTHTITQGTLTAGNNYIITFVDGILTVSRTVDIDKIFADNQRLIAYPNPTRGELSVVSCQSVENQKQIQVFNLSGRLVLQPTTNSFDISHLPNGVYLIKVNGETIRVVKQ